MSPDLLSDASDGALSLHGPWETLPDPVFALDAGWRVRAANAAARALLDAPPATTDADPEGRAGEVRPEPEGRSLLDLLPPRQASTVERCLHDATATPRVARHAVRDPDAGAARVEHVTVVPHAEEFWVVLHRTAPALSGVDMAAAVAGGDQPPHPVDVTAGLIEAGIALAATQSLDRLLQEVVDIARQLTGARYAALGIVDEAGTGLADFITSGLTPEQRKRIGDLPTGHGILGLLVRDARPLRLEDLRDHPASIGMPPNHPPMHSFIGMPVVTRGRVFGNLYLTDKRGEPEFTTGDLAIAQTLAAQAAVAIENAQLRHDRDRFFAAASHELGNAIAGVTLWARHLVRQPPEAQELWEQGVRNILSGAEQTARLIEDLLSLSRLREGRLALDAWEVRPADIVADAVDLLRLEAESCGVVVSASSAMTTRAIVADPVRVRQILVNLLVNAIKFTPSGRHVTLGVDSDAGGGVRAWVSDEGPGVPAEYRERIFQPYEQIASVARGRGSGLGLALSRQLARLMGGDLTVDDAPGGGALFTLTLPAVLPRKNELPYDKR
ncbi:MAG TPA: GAF domain-containing sensor histidine kinase [Gemmatimonadaceae bacterium]|nr:GAF domain-containing sensor histidine kinase [Gemmatimonadaceae bacterium]